MELVKFTIGTIVLLASASPVAAAQTVVKTDPADAAYAVPPAQYRSVFPGYRPFREQKLDDWKQVNKQVADSPQMGDMERNTGPVPPDRRPDGSQSMGDHTGHQR